MKFTKMQSAGNAYIYFFVKDGEFSNEKLRRIAIFASNEKFGIGGDGIITLERSRTSDFKMRIFNKDGSEGDICGNGVRCAAFLYRKSTPSASTVIDIETRVGKISVALEDISDKQCYAIAEMIFPKPYISSEKLSAALNCVGVNLGKDSVFAVNAGNAHLVAFTDEYSAKSLAESADKTTLFPYSVNVERADERDWGARIDVYERGSGETLSCGSGALATAYALAVKKFGKVTDCEFAVTSAGGRLDVSFKNDKAFLSGVVEEIFSGEIDLEI